MILLGWAVLGIAVGAAGAEILRAKRPDMVEKLESSAKRFADSICRPKPANKQKDTEAQ